MGKWYLFLSSTVNSLLGRNITPEKCFLMSAFLGDLSSYLVEFFNSKSLSVSFMWFSFWWEEIF